MTTRLATHLTARLAAPLAARLAVHPAARLVAGVLVRLVTGIAVGVLVGMGSGVLAGVPAGMAAGMGVHALTRRLLSEAGTSPDREPGIAARRVAPPARWPGDRGKPVGHRRGTG